MAQYWEPIETCVPVDGKRYDLWAEAIPLGEGLYTNPPKRYADCEFLPPPVMIAANAHGQIEIPKELWQWQSPDVGMMTPERFKITHWRDLPIAPMEELA